MTDLSIIDPTVSPHRFGRIFVEFVAVDVRADEGARLEVPDVVQLSPRVLEAHFLHILHYAQDRRRQGGHLVARSCRGDEGGKKEVEGTLFRLLALPTSASSLRCSGLERRSVAMSETAEDGAFLTPAEQPQENPFDQALVTPSIPTPAPGPPPTAPPPQPPAPAPRQQDDDDFELMASLRSQITDLSSQVTSLNTKLVRSYTRIGDLEDDLHDKGQKESRAQAKVEALENDKISWAAQIEQGGWIERVSTPPAL